MPDAAQVGNPGRVAAAEGSGDIASMPVRGRVRRRAWRRVSHGLHLPSPGCSQNSHPQAASAVLDRYRQRTSSLYPAVPNGVRDIAELRAWSLLVPLGAAFAHLTAAALRGWWLPPLPRDLPVFLAVPDAGWRPRRSGLHVTRHTSDIPYGGSSACRSANAPRSCSPPPAIGLLDLVILCDSAVLLSFVGHCPCLTGDQNHHGKRCFDCCTRHARFRSTCRHRSWMSTVSWAPAPTCGSWEPADWSSKTGHTIAMLGSMSATAPGTGGCRRSAGFSTATRQRRSDVSRS